MNSVVLDASAVLALLFDEQGAEKVENLFRRAADADTPMLISAINWAEVLYRMERKHGKAGFDTARRFETTMPLMVEPMDRDQAEAAARLKVSHHLALADAFAAALAKHKKAELVTGDKEFKAVEKEIKISWLK
jgi:PIN domain nuclease of toxin-antitoxin system